ncbi:MAG: prepilin-type N-terminal cleavage/methylation domain-containing protein [Peptococcaceae bacterium]|nr:prepilin-type N-terminal cleavage/methylation domain-containing protein [Peptococcaceae bacterium]
MEKLDKGFTIIELMIVIAIIGLLAIVLVPKVGSVKMMAKEAGLEKDITYIHGHLLIQIDKYGINERYVENGNYERNSSGQYVKNLAGKMEKILELNESLPIGSNDFENFDGYQNPYSGKGTILNWYTAINPSWGDRYFQPAVYITSAYRYNKDMIYPTQLVGTIIIYLQNGVEEVEVFYISHNQKAYGLVTVKP